jgi:hypothetical protein
MKDDGEKVELTFGDVRRAAEKCPAAKAVLTDLVPGAFDEPREAPWEDVTSQLMVYENYDELYVGFRGSEDFQFKAVAIPDKSGEYEGKIEGGRAFVRKLKSHAKD